MKELQYCTITFAQVLVWHMYGCAYVQYCSLHIFHSISLTLVRKVDTIMWQWWCDKWGKPYQIPPRSKHPFQIPFPAIVVHPWFLVAPFIRRMSPYHQTEVEKEKEKELHTCEEADTTLYSSKKWHGGMETKQPTNYWNKHGQYSFPAECPNKFHSIVNVEIITIHGTEKKVY